MTAPLWTSEAAAEATGGTVTRPWTITGITIDTRELVPGDLFVALRDVRDGHDFVADALKKGAAAALVSRIPDGVPADAPLLIVPDVLRALEELGRAARARTGARIVGVTGSVGKTSTKEMLRAILGGQGRTHAAERSFNNHWGVPLTLARMPADTDYAVIEIGMNHPGEIAPLARLARPHVALITTVAPAHLEAFDSVADIAREKAAIIDGLEPGGTAILPGDLEVTPVLTDRAVRDGVPYVLFGEGKVCDWRLIESRVTAEATSARADAKGRPILFRIHSAGRHFAMNGLAALAVAEALGLDLAMAILDLGQWKPPAGRGAVERVPLDVIDDAMAFDLIDDAFNSNPASLGAALDLLAVTEPWNGIGRFRKGRRVAILGDMLELGRDEVQLHRQMAAHPAMARVDIVHCVGPRMKALHAALPREKRGEWHETAPGLLPRLRHLIDAGDVVLVKGSKGIKLPPVVEALRHLGTPEAQAAGGD